MENIGTSLGAENRQTIVEGLNKLNVVSNCEANPSENECDDDVILIEHEIPVIDLCTPDVERRPRIPFADLYGQDFDRRQSVEHGNFFDRMNKIDTAIASKSPNRSRSAYERSVNGGETLEEFFHRMRQIYTENPSQSPNRLQSERSVDHGGETLAEFFERMKKKITEIQSKVPTNETPIVYNASHGEETLAEFFERMKKKYTELQSKLPTNKTSTVYNASEKLPVLCIICLRSAIGRQPQATFCGHVFCKYCIERAMTVKKECPTCKRPTSCVNPLYI